MDDLKMQKQTLKKAYKKTKRKHITPWKILAIICAVVMIVSIPLSILLQKFDNTCILCRLEADSVGKAMRCAANWCWSSLVGAWIGEKIAAGK